MGARGGRAILVILFLPALALLATPAAAFFTTKDPALALAPAAAVLAASPAPLGPNPGTIQTSCSRTCLSENCLVPPLLRYGKYCGVLYSGCPGEEPCDGLDACCFRHDTCIETHGNDYLNQECSQSLLECVEMFRMSGEPTFQNNTCEIGEVVDMISVVMHGALLLGEVHI